MNILITDDEQMVLRENKEMVGRVKPSAHLFCATTYIEAIKIIQTEQIDVAMLDIEMPGMNGLQLAARIKQESPDTNIIFVTAYTEYALEAFVFYYIIKCRNRYLFIQKVPISVNIVSVISFAFVPDTFCFPSIWVAK